MNYIISDRRNPLLAGIPPCKSRELSRREHSTSRLCSIHHDIPVTMHSSSIWSMVSVWPQWWQPVGGPRDKIWDLVAFGALRKFLVSDRRGLFGVYRDNNWIGLHSEQLAACLCHSQGSLLLAGPLSHYPQCHNSLASSRIGLFLSMPRGGSWYDKWEGFPYLHSQSPASKTLSQSRIQHHGSMCL